MALIITSTQALVLLAFLVLIITISRFFFFNKDSGFLKSQQVIGLRKEWFPWFRATALSIFETKNWAFEGYDKYSKTNTSFIVPTFDRGPLVVIPPHQIKSIYSLPENVVNTHGTQNETFQTKWTVWDRVISDNNFHLDVIRHQITKNLHHLTPKIAEEIDLGFEKWWGVDKEWKEVKVWGSCLKVIAGAANGAFCGAPLCRDDEFLEILKDHAIYIFAGATLINATPKLLKPISGVAVGLVCDYLLNKALKKCLPFVKERLANNTKLRMDPSYNWTPPKDGLQWIIDESYATGQPAQLDPKRVSHRLLLVNDISLHSTSFTMQNLILDLFSSDPSLGYVEALREECASVLEEAGGSWTRDAVKKLKLVESAIRESMRISPFGSLAIQRTVVHPHGISLENSEVPVPHGSVLALPLEPIHYDEELYPDARSFNAFRFAQPDNSRKAADGLAPNDDVGSENKAKSPLTQNETFLGFGYGKHACPGRFFALNEMKIFTAHMLLNYDVEYLTERPQPSNMLWLKLPANTSVRIRRKFSF